MDKFYAEYQKPGNKNRASTSEWEQNFFNVTTEDLLN